MTSFWVIHHLHSSWSFDFHSFSKHIVRNPSCLKCAASTSSVIFQIVSFIIGRNNFIYQQMIYQHVVVFLQDPHYYEFWDQLKDTGILDGRLISHVWRKFTTKEQRQFLDIMEHFDLICAASRLEGQRRTPAIEHVATAPFRNYYVPSLFNPGNVNVESNLASCESLAFFVDFHGFFTSKTLFWLLRQTLTCSPHFRKSNMVYVLKLSLVTFKPFSKHSVAPLIIRVPRATSVLEQTQYDLC